VTDRACFVTTTIREVMEKLTAFETDLMPLVDEDQRLLAIVTDGDIRRAIIRGVTIDQPVGSIANPDPVVVREGTPRDEMITLMKTRAKNSLPIVDERGRLVRVAFLNDLVEVDLIDNPAVIFAGGFGKRLRPYTDTVPKPMLRIGSKPLIERIIDTLVEEGICNIHALLHYRPEPFVEHFRGRKYCGQSINFVTEQAPRGTAGGLDLVRGALTKPFLILNGDNIVHTSWREMLSAHEEQENFITIGASTYSTVVPYGVLETENGRVVKITEKPIQSWLTVCSVYCASPGMLDYVPSSGQCDMPDVISAAIADGKRVGYFLVGDAQRIEDLAPAYSRMWDR